MPVLQVAWGIQGLVQPVATKPWGIVRTRRQHEDPRVFAMLYGIHAEHQTDLDIGLCALDNDYTELFGWSLSILNVKTNWPNNLHLDLERGCLDFNF